MSEPEPSPIQPGNITGAAFNKLGSRPDFTGAIGLAHGETGNPPGLDRKGQQALAAARTGAGERHGGRIASLLGRLKNIRFPFEMPAISRPDLAGVGETIDQNKVGRFLKGSAESYLNKFDPRGKDKKAWALGIVGGAGSVVAFAEFGATLGLSPALRGITAAAIIHGSNAIYDKLHTAYISRAIGGFDKSGARFLNSSANMAEIRGKVIELEKSVASQKLTGQAFVDEYRLKLDELLSPYINQDAISKEASRDELAQKLLDRLVKLGTDYAVVNSTAKSLAAGMAAGSFTAALGEVGVRTLLRGFPGGILSQETIGLPKTEGVVATPPTPTATVTETATITPTPSATGIPAAAPAETILPTETPTATLTPTETTTPVATSTPTAEATPAAVSTTPPTPTELPSDLKDKLNALEASQEYKTEIAAEVGKYLGARDEIVTEALKAKGILPAEVDTSSFDAGREAALHVMEGKGNEIFDNAVQQALQVNPNADLSQVTEAAQKAYADWLSSADAHTRISEAAQNAVANHLQIENTLAEKVTEGLSAHTDWFDDVPLERGVTAGKILDLTWTAADAPVMGANITANYDTLTDMWGNMAKVHPDLLANGNFPVSLSELNDLVAKAEAGDQEAIKRLRQALHWIPAGSKFRAVAASASREVLKLTA